MDKILYFENVTNIGNLYLQHIFNTFEYEPILFVCSDDYNNLYFCICSDFRYTQKWIIVKTDVDILNKLVLGEIDILSVFTSKKEMIEAVASANSDICYEQKNINDINFLDLPKAGTLLKCDIEEYNKFIKKYSQLIYDVCNNNQIENKTFSYSINMEFIKQQFLGNEVKIDIDDLGNEVKIDINDIVKNKNDLYDLVKTKYISNTEYNKNYEEIVNVTSDKLIFAA